MKLTPLLTKIAASLFIAAKAVKGQQCDGMPDSIANLPDAYFSVIKQTWCDLSANDPTGGEAGLFTLLVGAGLDADPSGAFFSTCLEDLIAGMKVQQTEAALVAAGKELEGNFWDRWQCDGTDGTKTTVVTMSTVTMDKSKATGGYRQFVNPWNLWICKAASCDSDILSEVLNSIALEYYELGQNPWVEGTIISDTITPTLECLWNQTGNLMGAPETYCSGESAPACSNKKLIEVQLGTDAPFELAICDDNDCLASMKDTRPLENAIGSYDPFYGNPFCLPEESYRGEFTSIEITALEKDFNLSDYCSAAAASGRTGRCKTPTEAPTVKAVASETESAPAESAAWMTMESFVLKCFVGLIPLLLL